MRYYKVLQKSSQGYLLLDLDIEHYKQEFDRKYQGSGQSQQWKTKIWVKSKHKLYLKSTYRGYFINTGSLPIGELPEFIKC